jgi:hypothetical protein
VAHDEVVQALAYALRFDARGRSHRLAGELTARIAAETLADYLDQAGFVLMRRPAAEAHGRNNTEP